MRPDLPPKFPIGFFMWSNPDPHPNVAFVSPGYGAVIEGHAHRPRARVIAQPLETQARVRWIRTKLSIRRVSRRFDSRRESVVQLPEFGRPDRLHSCLSNSSSVNSVNCSGFSRKRASISSRNFVSFGRGVGSLMIRLHSASPSSSGSREGIDSTRRARSPGDNCLIASSISAAVLTTKFCNKARGFTTPLPVR